MRFIEQKGKWYRKIHSNLYVKIKNWWRGQLEKWKELPSFLVGLLCRPCSCVDCLLQIRERAPFELWLISAMPLLVASYIDRVSYTRLSSSARPLDRLHQHTPGWIRRELMRLKKRVSSKLSSTTDKKVMHRKKHQVQPKKVDFRIWLMNIVFVLHTPLGQRRKNPKLSG